MSEFDTTPAPVPAQSPDAFRDTLSDHDTLDAGLREANKAALFVALAAAGLTHVVVTFDGYGDSGQIESVDARSGEDAAELPDVTVTFAVVRWGQPDPVTRDLAVADAIEHLAYDYLSDTHCGWENNDGAYGEFVFDVAAGTITLDHNDRYTAVESYTHEF